jgi:small conductance mechanosensitive channel
MTQCGDSALIFVIRVWAENSNYWNCNFFLLEEGKRALDTAGISIPYPQMDVHLKRD